MYSDVSTTLDIGGTAPGGMGEMVGQVGDMFVAIIPVALPVLGGIAVGFFAIKVVRALLHI